MVIEKVQEVIQLLDNRFDAHDFILAFVRKHTHSYFRILGRYNGDIRLTDAWIGSFLQKNADELKISEAGKTVSMNIMSNETECMSWKKR